MQKELTAGYPPGNTADLLPYISVRGESNEQKEKILNMMGGGGDDALPIHEKRKTAGEPGHPSF